MTSKESLCHFKTLSEYESDRFSRLMLNDIEILQKDPDYFSEESPRYAFPRTTRFTLFYKDHNTRYVCEIIDDAAQPWMWWGGSHILSFRLMKEESIYCYEYVADSCESIREHQSLIEELFIQHVKMTRMFIKEKDIVQLLKKQGVDERILLRIMEGGYENSNNKNS